MPQQGAEDLPAVAAGRERRLIREAEEIPGEQRFATALLVEFDCVAQRVALTNHGHVEPVLISCGEVRVLAGPPALPLGLGGLAAAEGAVGVEPPRTPTPDGSFRRVERDGEPFGEARPRLMGCASHPAKQHPE
ncbi:SpoIIE family protein phosphatase [Streptomyces sp. NRRL F-2580]|uniref:SpoIIE family protein phosphatase n=1 Tax=Streptomyces sp. NRRL F-2580 TaxID=1463841 RepID=UPI0004C685FC|nr:SpoIIE family protein phosphatase [Streptomyces sp. NRRL F-2580]